MKRPYSLLPTRSLWMFFACVLAACLLVACQPGDKGRSFNMQKTPFVAPTEESVTIDETSPILAAPGEESSTGIPANQPTAVVQCRDSLSFLKDVTIPDGTSVAPDSTLDKRWEVENNGNCNWGKEYRIRLVAGPELGTQKEQALYPARSGSRAVLRIVFKAPIEPGTYRSAWQAFNPAGEPFGDPFFIEIKVEAP
jgi:hypothetical protein